MARPGQAGAKPATDNSARVKDDHRHRERDETQELCRGEADEQTTLLAVRSCRVAQRALEEGPKHVADADRRSADANRRETGADNLCGSEIHRVTPCLELVKVDRVVEVQ